MVSARLGRKDQSGHLRWVGGGAAWLGGPSRGTRLPRSGGGRLAPVGVQRPLTGVESCPRRKIPELAPPTSPEWVGLSRVNFRLRRATAGASPGFRSVATCPIFWSRCGVARV